MASIADLYGDSNSESANNRLLSARSGEINSIQNMQPRSGWAAPALAYLAGSATKNMGEENEKKAKVQQFMATFGKLAAVNGGASVRFWNTHAKEALGTDVKIDKAERNAGNLKLQFENGKMVVLDSGAGEILTVGKDGKLEPIDETFLKEFESNWKKDKESKKTGGKSNSSEVNNIRNKIREFTAQLARYGDAKPDERARIEKEIANLKRQYKEEKGVDYDADEPATPSASAPAASADSLFSVTRPGASMASDAMSAGGGGGYEYRGGKLIKK